MLPRKVLKKVPEGSLKKKKKQLLKAGTGSGLQGYEEWQNKNMTVAYFHSEAPGENDFH